MVMRVVMVVDDSPGDKVIFVEEGSILIALLPGIVGAARTESGSHNPSPRQVRESTALIPERHRSIMVSGPCVLA